MHNPPSKGDALEVRRVTRRFGPVTAVDDVSLRVSPGEVMALLGPSGCGKTTLLRIVAGLEQADAGEVWLGQRRIDTLPTQARKVGLVFQDLALFPHLTVADNIAFGLRDLPVEQRRARVAEWLRRVALEGLGERAPHQLSGGQRQRVAVARSLATQPRLLLLDEPFSSLDVALRRQVRSELRDILADQNIPTVLVTHDREDAFALAHRVAVMRDGKLVQVAPTREAVASPRDRFVAELLSDACLIAVAELGPQGARTELGWVKTHPPTGSGARWALVVRPSAVLLEEAGELGGEVREVVFAGDHERVRLGQGGSHVWAWASAGSYRVGQRVCFSLREEELSWIPEL